MSNKIGEIYKFLLSETDYLKDSGKDIERKVQELLRKDNSISDAKEYEEFRDILFAMANFAEETGFVKGFQYAVMLMSECYIAKELL